MKFHRHPLASYAVSENGRPGGAIDLDRLDFDLPPYTAGEYRLSRMVIKDQGKGTGTKLLSLLCKDADQERVNLVVEASPYHDRSPEGVARLIRFYGRFGFEEIPDFPGTMRRLPRVTVALPVTKKRGRKRTEDKHPGLIQDLGTAPDADIAAKYGVSVACVSNQRRKLNLPHFGSFAHRAGNPAPEDQRVVVLVKMLDDNTVQVLNSRTGIRVYDKDHVDPRNFDNEGRCPPLMCSWAEAKAHLEETETPCLIPLRLAKLILNNNFSSVLG